MIAPGEARRRVVVLLAALAALAGACRGERRAAPKDAARDAAPATHSVVPALPRSEDGAAWLRALDHEIASLDDPAGRIARLLERAAIRGRLEDYERALAESAAHLEAHAADPAAHKLRIRALLAVHRFAAARAAIAELAPRVDASELVDLAVAVDEAAGHRDRALAARRALADVYRDAEHVTLHAAALARAGRTAEAIALVPQAAAAIRTNTARYFGWLLFQWGRIYEHAGETAAARALYAASHARLPGAVDTVEHLARALIATGEPEAARRLMADAARESEHPAIVALAAELGVAGDVARAAARWEHYVAALPEAFADHAARFYLGPGANAARAHELARLDHANRDTPDSRVLAIDAALAAGEPAAACGVARLIGADATRAEQFAAWKALSRCGRRDDADRLARSLGIAQ